MILETRDLKYIYPDGTGAIKGVDMKIEEGKKRTTDERGEFRFSFVPIHVFFPSTLDVSFRYRYIRQCLLNHKGGPHEH